MTGPQPCAPGVSSYEIKKLLVLRFWIAYPTIGASANVVTVGIAEAQGYRISFMEYMTIAFVPMIISIVLCTIWLLVVKM